MPHQRHPGVAPCQGLRGWETTKEQTRAEKETLLSSVCRYKHSSNKNKLLPGHSPSSPRLSVMQKPVPCCPGEASADYLQ